MNYKLLECAKADLEREYDYITEGAIIRSRTKWYEKGEKGNAYFLSLEKANKRKSSIKSLKVDEHTKVDRPQDVLSAIKRFYSKLYSKGSSSSNEDRNFLDLNLPSLSEIDKLHCEGQLTPDEVFSIVHSLPDNKSQGNDGLK